MVSFALLFSFLSSFHILSHIHRLEEEKHAKQIGKYNKGY